MAVAAVVVLLLINLAATAGLAYELREKEASLQRVVAEARDARTRLVEIGDAVTLRLEGIEAEAAAARSTAAAFDELCAEMAALQAQAAGAPVDAARFDTAGRIVVSIASACARRG